MALRLEKMGAKGHSRKYRGVARKAADGRPVFTGKITLGDYELPRRWRKPRMIFVNSMSDLFHEDVPVEFIGLVFEEMVRCPRHTFQVLTKRPERLAELADYLPWPKNVWIGTSIESADYVDRVGALASVSDAAVRFLSCEPLLGPLPNLPLDDIDWVIAGGESGPRSRPMEQSWVVDIRDQCQGQSVPFFFKQWGGRRKWAAGRELQGRTWDEFPVPREEGPGQWGAMAALTGRNLPIDLTADSENA